jgi:hypothetical protein
MTSKDGKKKKTEETQINYATDLVSHIKNYTKTIKTKNQEKEPDEKLKSLKSITYRHEMLMNAYFAFCKDVDRQIYHIPSGEINQLKNALEEWGVRISGILRHTQSNGSPISQYLSRHKSEFVSFINEVRLKIMNYTSRWHKNFKITDSKEEFI